MDQYKENNLTHLLHSKDGPSLLFILPLKLKPRVEDTYLYSPTRKKKYYP